MSPVVFTTLIFFGLAVVFFFFKRRIADFMGSDPLYWCWILMITSNMGLPSTIQYATRLFGMAVSVFFLFAHFANNRLILRRNSAGILLFFYIVLCMYSTTYSVSRLQTLVKSLELITDLGIIWVLYTKEDGIEFTRKIMIVTLSTFMVLLCITLVGFFIFPSFFADDGFVARSSLLGTRLGGGLLGANKASALSALCVAWAILLMEKETRLQIAIVFVCSMIMFYSQSRSSMALLFGIILLRLFSHKKRWLYVLVLIGIAIIAVSNLNLIIQYLVRGQTAEAIASLTGRKVVWAAASTFIEQRPILGYGFGAGGELVAFDMFDLATMHSGIYETLLGTGIVGLTLLIIQYASIVLIVIRNVLKYGLKNNLVDCFLVVYYAVRTYTSVGIGNWHSQEVMFWYMFMFILWSGKSLHKSYIDGTHVSSLSAGGHYSLRYGRFLSCDN